MAFKKVNPKLNIPEVENEVLLYWEKNSIFKKSVESRPVEKTFSFYDGPPFATGTPHYGHLVAGPNIPEKSVQVQAARMESEGTVSRTITEK